MPPPMVHAPKMHIVCILPPKAVFLPSASPTIYKHTQLSLGTPLERYKEATLIPAVRRICSRWSVAIHNGLVKHPKAAYEQGPVALFEEVVFPAPEAAARDKAIGHGLPYP